VRLLDLEPRWIEADGRRLGFVFRCPTKPIWWQSCFIEHVERRDQWRLLEETTGGSQYQACNPDARWVIAGGIQDAVFETLTVSPSLDGSAGGLWHGHILNGQIVGGL